MQVEYNSKAIKHISSTFDYYLEYFGKQATENLAANIDGRSALTGRYPANLIKSNK